MDYYGMTLRGSLTAGLVYLSPTQYGATGFDNATLDAAVIDAAMPSYFNTTINGPYLLNMTNDHYYYRDQEYYPYYCQLNVNNTKFKDQAFFTSIDSVSGCTTGVTTQRIQAAQYTFAGDLAIQGGFDVDTKIISQVLGNNKRVSMDLGRNWLVSEDTAGSGTSVLTAQDVIQLRYRLGLDGTATAPSTGTTPNLLDSVERGAIADAVLSRSVANAEANANPNEPSLCSVALAMAHSNTTAHQGKLTIYKTDGKEFTQRPITSNSGAPPITGIG